MNLVFLGACDSRPPRWPPVSHASWVPVALWPPGARWVCRTEGDAGKERRCVTSCWTGRRLGLRPMRAHAPPRSPRSPSLPLRPTLALFIWREVSSHVVRKLFWEVHVAVNSAHLPFTV